MGNKINKSIDISVIIPVFNRENTIQNCINSVLNQTFLPLEIIIINDGSNDKTVSKVKELNNSLIKIIHNEDNRGAQHARNQGIKSAKCKWITFLDSDKLPNHRINNSMGFIHKLDSSVKLNSALWR